MWLTLGLLKYSAVCLSLKAGLLKTGMSFKTAIVDEMHNEKTDSELEHTSDRLDDTTRLLGSNIINFEFYSFITH